MAMSKKDFIALADAIKEHNADAAREISKPFTQEFTNDQIMALAHFCRSQNPRFMASRWMDYIADLCGPNGVRSK